MMLPFIVLPEVEEELRDTMRWYEGRRSGLGLEFLGSVERAFTQIMDSPSRYPCWTDDDRYRRVVLPRFPFVVFYELRMDSIEIVAVAHTSRLPGYWTQRKP
jgi:plasmid stabilization system protein ParE